MPNNIAHFAIAADDCPRARRFYETVFGWTFEAWGPPDFWLIRTGPGGIPGALQRRRQPAGSPGHGGYECTIAVDDVEAIARSIERAGGRLLMKPVVIERVGTVVHFEDTEGNVACAMQYLPGLSR